MRIIPQWFVALILYAIIVTVLILLQPSLLFRPDGTVKQFGVGLVEGKSIFSAAIVFPLLGVLCYIFSSLFKLALV